MRFLLPLMLAFAMLAAGDSRACTPDPTFGDAGWLATPAAIGEGGGSTIVRDAAGRYAIVGQSLQLIGGDEIPPARLFYAQVARHERDGVLDTTFGMGGFAPSYLAGVFGAAGEQARVLDAALDADGGAFLLVDTAMAYPLLVHVFGDGEPDPGFGGGDPVLGGAYAACGSPAQGGGFALLRDGDARLVVASRAPGQLVVARFLANGARDTTFGTTGGCARYPLGQRSAVAVFDRGESGYELVGGTAGEIFTFRITPEGTPDTTHGTNGLATVATPFGAALDAGRWNGGVVAALGASGSILPTELVVARLTPEGQLDGTFGDGGYVATKLPASDPATMSQLAVASDGRVALFGANTVPNFPALVVLDAHGDIASGCTEQRIFAPLRTRGGLFDGDRLLMVGDTSVGGRIATGAYAIDTGALFSSSFE